MPISIKHGSRTKRADARREETTVVWQGTFEEIAAFDATLQIGDFAQGLGYLTNKSLSQGEGVVWALQLDYALGLTGGNLAADDGPVEQKLSVKPISVPIEAHPNYKTCWNHFLVGKCIYEGTNYADTVPSWYTTATDPYLDPQGDGQHYKWVKSLAEAPVATRTEQWSIVKSGQTVCKPIKPGTTTFDFAHYVITETGYHSTKNKAGWAANKLINTIVKSPLQGDFGLTPAGFNWKVDDIQIEYDGEQWVAARTYTRSGDNQGWDRDLYTYNY